MSSGGKIQIAIAEGDGIGPEIMSAVRMILEQAGAPLSFHPVEIGEKVYLRGHRSGIEPHTWDVIRESKGFLKAPITTPQGGGFKSLNVTIRTALGLYANIRPCVAYHPFVATKHPAMNVTIVRENEEDLYTGIEYRQSLDSYHALKILTRPGCERIIRYAFEYARTSGRQKVTCFTKDNILKLSDGLFHRTFEALATEYPDILNEHWIVDIGAAKLADTPTAFDVIVLPNLYGDILSDVAAQIAGSVGLAGSANIGLQGAMFEAIHGSAPRRAGQNVANPSGLLLAAIMMLVHVGLPQAAAMIHNAWLTTLEEGIHTYDIYNEETSHQRVGTKEFAQAVTKNFGRLPHTLPMVQYSDKPLHTVAKQEVSKRNGSHKQLVGVDIFIDWRGSVEELQRHLTAATSPPWKLSFIGNRGVTLWPHHHPETFCSDSWRARFLHTDKGSAVTHQAVASLLSSFANNNIDFTHTEHLYTFNDIPGFSLFQDEQ